MTDCSKIPVELILATTDPELFNDSAKRWTWTGTMYWAVDCLDNKQTTISDSIVPPISPGSYIPLKTTPESWDFCDAVNCRAHSGVLLVVFTFDPSSRNPRDFLQFVVDLRYQATDYPLHGITDAKGDLVYLDITQVSKTPDAPYAEIWVSRSAHQHDTDLISPEVSVPRDNMFIWFSIILAVIFMIILVIVVYAASRKN